MRTPESADSPTARTPTVAVVGNPNAGKTTVFNRLTGLSQRAGNFPGVTVEKKEGFCQLDEIRVRLLDLPGTYSLAALSPDEMVAVDVLLGQQEGEQEPDAIIVVVDASNLQRNLYLFSQIMELGVPVVMALNMMDIATARNITIDVAALSQRLGVPVIPTTSHRGVGIAELREAVRDLLESQTAAIKLQDTLHDNAQALFQQVSSEYCRTTGLELHPFEALRALVDQGGPSEKRLRRALGDSFDEKLNAARAAVDGSVPLPAVEAQLRYQWIGEQIAGCVHRGQAETSTHSERIDRILTHRVLGLVIFAALMLLLFQSIFAWAKPLMAWIDGLFVSAGDLISSFLPEGAFQSLLVDGVISGVGMIVVFLPQILILFFFIGLLEDFGYMARAAFLMDKFMSKCGLSGKSFIPMLSGFACAVPAIMGTRVIENRRDRLATILVTPLMSCSARLPIYAIFIGAFIPDDPLIPGFLGLQAFTLFSLYLLGMVMAVAMAWAFKKTLLRGPKPPFVLELPSYKWPSLRVVLLRVFDRGQAFLVRAGTIILAVAILVWALSYYPHPEAIGEKFVKERAEVEAQMSPGVERESALQELDRQEAGEYLRQSAFGRLGRWVQPCFEPLGWDWRISMAAIAAFPAREVLLTTLGTTFNLGSDVDEESRALLDSLKSARRGPAGAPLFTIPVTLSILVFFALCCQCSATLATVRRETNSWRWAGFAFVYMTVLAYLCAALTYQVSALV